MYNHNCNEVMPVPHHRHLVWHTFSTTYHPCPPREKVRRKSHSKLEWPVWDQKMRHNLCSKGEVSDHIMHSVNGEFLLKFDLSYQTANFYQMAQYPSIAKTILRSTVFLDLSTPVRYLQQEIPHKVTSSLRSACTPASIHVSQCKKWVPDVIDQTCD